MRQILQELGSGRTILAEVPAPAAPHQGLLVRTSRSLISAGTERMLVEFGRAGWLDKARQQPEKVRQVLAKMSTDGVGATLEAVRSKLDQAVPLGYCNVGVVVEGNQAPGFNPGDRVVSNGPHAELVAVPRNLCARVPEEVSDDAAAFTVLGSIGLQGLRLAAPTLGESFIVTGLGLIGLITVQLLRANGCRVLGIDPDPAKTEVARRFGAVTVELSSGEDPLAAAERFTAGRGADGVLITAATQSDELMSQAAKMCRKRGRIVLIGVAGLHLNRADFYEKELSFQVSCSYGPGRYDPQYEQGGQDYPLPFVRWTQQRNFEAVLEMMARGALDVAPLISHRFEVAEATRAYDLLAADDARYLGILLEYPQPAGGDVAPPVRTIGLGTQGAASSATAEAVVGVIGAGNYASRILIPALAGAGARLKTIASSGGVSAGQVGRKAGFSVATTDINVILEDPDINTVVIATRHDSHARLVERALAAGKHVFVEKPLALSAAEVDGLEALPSAAGRQPLLMVGFNRRFAPHIVRMKSLLESTPGPKTFVVTVNAGAIPAAHWTQDSRVGGGRIIGEGCHFIDLLRFLSGAPIERWQVMAVGGNPQGGVRDDKVSILLGFADGSIGTVHYFANGHASFPKERVEVFCDGRILQLDNFRRLRGFGWNNFGTLKLWRQDKGQAACAAAFVTAISTGGPSPIPREELFEVARVTVAIGAAARQ